MKKALISPNEKTNNPNNGNILGIRIAQVSDEAFEVALPLYWIDCSDDTQADFYYFDETDNTIKQVPAYILPPIKPKVANPNQPETTGTTTI
jgi:hypothetical protein